MNLRKIGATALCCCAIFAVSIPIAAQTMTKALVAEKIRRVEDGVDEFRNYLERRGDNARNATSTAQQSGRASGRRGTANTEARKTTAQAGKDELDDALGDLNSSTNRLRRKFDATEKWIETKAQVERWSTTVAGSTRLSPEGSTGPTWPDCGQPFGTASTIWHVRIMWHP